MPAGKLVIQLIQVTSLKDTSCCGDQDVYVIVRCAERSFRTELYEGTRIKFQEKFTVEVQQLEQYSIELWAETSRVDVLLGTAVVPLEQVYQDSALKMYYPVYSEEGEYNGRIQVKSSYIAYGSGPHTNKAQYTAPKVQLMEEHASTYVNLSRPAPAQRPGSETSPAKRRSSVRALAEAVARTAAQAGPWRHRSISNDNSHDDTPTTSATGSCAMVSLFQRSPIIRPKNSSAASSSKPEAPAAAAPSEDHSRAPGSSGVVTSKAHGNSSSSLTHRSPQGSAQELPTVTAMPGSATATISFTSKVTDLPATPSKLPEPTALDSTTSQFAHTFNFWRGLQNCTSSPRTNSGARLPFLNCVQSHDSQQEQSQQHQQNQQNQQQGRAPPYQPYGLPIRPIASTASVASLANSVASMEGGVRSRPAVANVRCSLFPRPAFLPARPARSKGTSRRQSAAD